MTFFSLLLAAQLSSASGHAAAKKLYDAATIDFKLGSFDKALEEFGRAYKLDPLPSLLFNMGQCHRELGHWKQALFFFRSYLHDRPTAPNRLLVEKMIAEAEAGLRSAVATRNPPAPTTPPPSAPAKPATIVLVEAPSAPRAAPEAVVSPSSASRPRTVPEAALSEAPSRPPRRISSGGPWWLAGGAVVSAAAGAMLAGLGGASTAGDITSSAGPYTLHSVPASQYVVGYHEALAGDVLFAVGGALAVGAGAWFLAR